jgi:hypothetical protein
MGDPDLDALARAARRRRRLPPDARCAVCGTREHLTLRDGVVRCYAHVRPKDRAPSAEADHLAGRANLGGLTVRLRAADHRTVTELRTQLGIDAWPPAEGDPLRTLAHFLAGLATLLFLEAEWLMGLAAHLEDRLGSERWDDAPPGPLDP